MATTTEKLARLISQAEFDRLPPEVVEVAKTVILAGSVEPPARIVAEYARDLRGFHPPGLVGLLGRGPASGAGCIRAGDVL